MKKRNLQNTECVTGDSEDPTHLPIDLVLTAIRAWVINNTEHEIRILITTDVLSEGQNLQDAHIVLNYDLPWAIISLFKEQEELTE